MDDAAAAAAAAAAVGLHAGEAAGLGGPQGHSVVATGSDQIALAFPNLDRMAREVSLRPPHSLSRGLPSRPTFLYHFRCGCQRVK